MEFHWGFAFHPETSGVVTLIGGPTAVDSHEVVDSWSNWGWTIFTPNILTCLLCTRDAAASSGTIPVKKTTRKVPTNNTLLMTKQGVYDICALLKHHKNMWITMDYHHFQALKKVMFIANPATESTCTNFRKVTSRQAKQEALGIFGVGSPPNQQLHLVGSFTKTDDSNPHTVDGNQKPANSPVDMINIPLSTTVFFIQTVVGLGFLNHQQ